MDSGKLEGFRRKGGGGWVSRVLGIKEGTDCVEHWVWCLDSEPWNTGSGTDVFYGDEHNTMIIKEEIQSVREAGVRVVHTKLRYPKGRA